MRLGLLLLTAVVSLTTGEVCQVPLDVAIILDASGSVSSQNWQLMVDFTNNLLNQVKIGPTDVRMAIMQFSSSYSIISNLNADQTNAELITRFNTATRVSGGTDTYRAIDAARTLIFGNNPRSVKKIVILATDGLSNNKAATASAAIALQQVSNMHVFAIGIGGYSLSEIHAIASDPDSFYASTLTSFNILYAIAATLGPQFCRIGQDVFTGITCLSDDNCATISNSGCESNMCSCLSERLQYDATVQDCVPRLNFCNTAADCALSNGALCDTNTDVCKCPTGTVCKTCKLGNLCDVTLQCTDAITGWACDNTNNIQACNQSRVQTGDYFCKIRGVGQSCTKDIHCSEMNGTCPSGLCVCSHVALVYDPIKIRCIPRQLGDSCISASECGFINDVTCHATTKTCQCLPPFVSTSGTVCGPCQTESYTYVSTGSGGYCKLKVIGDPCSADGNCQNVANSACLGGKCFCAPKHTNVGLQSTYCGYCGVGAQCVTNIDCSSLLPHTQCVGNILGCKSGYHENDLGKCSEPWIGMKCLTATDCAPLIKTSCSNGVCSCLPGTVQLSTTGCDTITTTIATTTTVATTTAVVTTTTVATTTAVVTTPGEAMTPVPTNQLSGGAVAAIVLTTLLGLGLIGAGAIAGALMIMQTAAMTAAMTATLMSAQAASVAVSSTVASSFGVTCLAPMGGNGAMVSAAPLSPKYKPF